MRTFSRITISLTLATTVALLSGCGHGIGTNTAASTVASLSGVQGASNIQILTGNLDTDLYRNLMAVRAALEQLNTAAAGDPVLTGIASRLDADFNAVLAHVAHYRAIFGIAQAAISENIKLQGEPVDWGKLQPIGPVPLSPSAPVPLAPTKPPGG